MLILVHLKTYKTRDKILYEEYIAFSLSSKNWYQTYDSTVV